MFQLKIIFKDSLRNQKLKSMAQALYNLWIQTLKSNSTLLTNFVESTLKHFILIKHKAYNFYSYFIGYNIL